MWRLGFSLLIVVAFWWGQVNGATAPDQSRRAGAGGWGWRVTRLHFGRGNASIHLTTIAASVTLVSLQPAVVAVISAVALPEAPSTRQTLGIAVAIGGALIIAAPTSRPESRPAGNQPLARQPARYIRGCDCRHLLHHRSATPAGRSESWAYVGIVYTAAFLTLLAIACRRCRTSRRSPRGRSRSLLGSRSDVLIGHTGMNWALKYLPAYVVNLTVLG